MNSFSHNTILGKKKSFHGEVRVVGFETKLGEFKYKIPELTSTKPKRRSHPRIPNLNGRRHPTSTTAVLLWSRRRPPPPHFHHCIATLLTPQPAATLTLLRSHPRGTRLEDDGVGFGLEDDRVGHCDWDDGVGF
ncbi:hypothetical protein Droror1_Dr00011844 [Drosera rotundifolia]